MSSGPGAPFGRIFLKASLSSSSVNSGTKLRKMSLLTERYLRFLFSVRSSLDISILLTPAQCFIKMSVFLLSDVIHRYYMTIVDHDLVTLSLSIISGHHHW